jgi:hypothetical protein
VGVGSTDHPVLEETTVKCPFCPEESFAEAKKCCYCGEWLAAPSGSARREASGRGIAGGRPDGPAYGSLGAILLCLVGALGVWVHWTVGVVIAILVLIGLCR